MSGLKSNILVCGGYDSGSPLTSLECYDITIDQWVVLNFSLPTALLRCKCFKMTQHNILIVGIGLVNQRFDYGHRRIHS